MGWQDLPRGQRFQLNRHHWPQKEHWTRFPSSWLLVPLAEEGWGMRGSWARPRPSKLEAWFGALY